MDSEHVVQWAKHTVEYLKNDKLSFEKVINDADLQGKLGFAMISTAMAACDSFAWVLYQSFDLRKANKALFCELLNDSRFFTKKKYYNEAVFYGLIRCGVIHQLYPKKAGISARIRDEILYVDRTRSHLYINSYALYCDVLEACEKIRDHFAGASEPEKTDYSLRLWIRQKIDDTEASKANLDFSALPVLP